VNISANVLRTTKNRDRTGIFNPSSRLLFVLLAFLIGKIKGTQWNCIIHWVPSWCECS